MTNNPTIDGVSRELLEQIHKELTSGAVSIGTGAKVRTLLDREVITDDHLRQRIAFLTSEVPAKSDVNAVLQSTIARLEARITQLESEEPEWSAMQQRLGDENAQLRSRIAELDSGRGEAFGYWLDPKNEERQGMFAKVTKEDAVVDSASVNDFFNITPLFTAPPAPVAVVLPGHLDSDLRSPAYGFSKGWNACLDATAALNGLAK